MSRLHILLLSDEVDKALYDHFSRDMFKDIDVIISCGDLPARYLTFLATLFSGPVLYVPGNHDTTYETHPPEGCINIDGKIYEYKGVRFAGLGGCRRYKPGPYQYTEKEMAARIRKLRLPLWKSGGCDVFVTHSPAKGHHDGKGCHEGFACFNDFIKKYRPGWFFYGHQHLNYTQNAKRQDTIEQTVSINSFGKYITVIDTEPRKKSAD